MSTFPLNEIVSVVVNLSPISVVRPSFSLGLIIGSSTHISAATRVKTYNSLTEMAADGFVASDAEYEAAQIYFQQQPKPKKVAIGRWDKTGAETAVQAVTACRIANSEWYACYLIDATKAEILSIASYIEATTPETAFFYDTSDADVPTGTAGNVFLTLKGLLRRRSLGQYTTKDYAAVAIMGYAMAANVSAANSTYSLAYKIERGVEVESIDQTALTNILNANGNVYINQGSYYNVFRQGKMADGASFDELLGLDMLVNSIQLSVMDLLTSMPKIPQTEDGVAMIINVINEVCAESAQRGFLAPGEWGGPTVLNLETGDTLTQGFVVQAETIASQSQADRDARVSPPIYVCVKLAGAIEFVNITINVNR